MVLTGFKPKNNMFQKFCLVPSIKSTLYQQIVLYQPDKKSIVRTKMLTYTGVFFSKAFHMHVSCIWNLPTCVQNWRNSLLICGSISMEYYSRLCGRRSSCLFCCNRLRFGEIPRLKVIQLVFNRQSVAEKVNVFHFALIRYIG